VQLVTALAATGVGRQDRVALLSRNSIEFGELMAAAQLSGIILAPINFRLSQSEVHDALHRVMPAVLVCESEFVPMISGIRDALPDLKRVVTIGAETGHASVDYEDFIASGEGGQLPYAARPDDLLYLVSTSGTTGASKYCMIGQREWAKATWAMNAELRAGCDDRMLVTMPTFHAGAIGLITAVHARGGAAILQRQYDPAEAVNLLASEQITIMHQAPVMLQAMLNAAKASARFESVRMVMYAAAPMPIHTLRHALKTMPAAGFLNLYGLSEGAVTSLPPELHTDGADAENILRSVGFPLPGLRIRIVDDTGREVAAGAAGEISVRSDALFRGYWNDDAATLKVLRDGWFHTGDVGRIDDRGLLHLLDRKKDIIVSGGENVYSPEVEDVVRELPEIQACAVVGAPDERWGEAVCAVVVIRPGASVTLSALQTHVRSRLGGFKVPRRLEIVDELPVLPTGKVDKKRLRARMSA
jgi:acyl-CoA synthetase (AMP-forming)/AMP-acid ligase II